MLNYTPTNISPLQYPKGDTSIPERGAMGVPVDLQWKLDTSFQVSLLIAQQQKFFGPLRCIWIDASANTHPIVASVNGTEQVFTIPPGTANYYPVVNLNSPVVLFTIGAAETTVTRVIFLNFVPPIGMQGQLSIAGTVTVAGTVSVNNFPALQKVDLTDVGGSAINIGQALMAKSLPVVIASDQSAIPASQSGAWAVSVSNFPATQPVSGTVAATQSGAWNVGRTWSLSSVSDSVSVVQSTSPWVVSLASTTITGTVAVTQSGAWNVGITGTPSFNLAQVGGTAIALGQTTMTKSVPVTLASDQSVLSVMINGPATIQGGTPVTGTTAVAQITSAFTRIRSVSILANSPVLAAGSVTFTLTDGLGVARIGFVIPVGTSTSSIYTVLNFSDMNVTLTNGGSNATASLSANLTSGSISAFFGVQ